jgi:transcriptional regulator with XRE-family HTH domain
VANTAGPNVRQRRVARNLRAWRKAAGMTMEEVGKKLRWSGPKLSRFERAEVNAGPAEIIALAAILSIDEAERDQMVALAVGSMEQPGWWMTYAPDVVPNYFADYLETEAEATEVRAVETLLIPGLLQSPRYTDAIVRAWLASPDEDLVDERRRVRQKRQARLDDEINPLALHVIIHENALTQEVGGPDVMTEQLDLLATRAKQPNVTVQVLPKSVGEYPGMGCAYTTLSFDGADAAAVFLENLNSGLYVEEADSIDGYILNFRRLAKLALEPEASIQLIMTRNRMGVTDKE